jgi:hypothetical protein
MEAYILLPKRFVLVSGLKRLGDMFIQDVIPGKPFYVK